MVLFGRVWNSLNKDDRMAILRQIPKHESIRELESGLKWDELLPSTQRDLLNVDAETILGRELCP